MKKILIVFFLTIFNILALLGAENKDSEIMMRSFLHLYPNINHAYTSLHPSIAVGENAKYYPMLGSNISLNETYFLEACFGAGKLDDINGGLAQYSIGLGMYNEIKGMENFYYTFALSLRNFNATYINSSALVLEALFEEKVGNLYFGLGFDLVSQDYEILSGSEYLTGSDRIYHASFIAYARTGLVDIRACGLPESINVNFSINLNMDKK